MFTLTACGEDGDDAVAHAEQTAPNGDVFNDADVDFATAMIPHHAQALVMVDLTRDRDLSPQVQRLIEDIREAQSLEIELMVDWLTAWDRPIPATMRDHVNAEHSDGMDDQDTGDMGEMGEMDDMDDMDELEAVSGPEFEDMWLEMMIEHHEGAVEMAQDEQAAGIFEPALDLAGSIETSQQAEIDQMRDLLAS